MHAHLCSSVVWGPAPRLVGFETLQTCCFWHGLPRARSSRAWVCILTQSNGKINQRLLQLTPSNAWSAGPLDRLGRWRRQSNTLHTAALRCSSVLSRPCVVQVIRQCHGNVRGARSEKNALAWVRCVTYAPHRGWLAWLQLPRAARGQKGTMSTSTKCVVLGQSCTCARRGINGEEG